MYKEIMGKTFREDPYEYQIFWWGEKIPMINEMPKFP